MLRSFLLQHFPGKPLRPTGTGALVICALLLSILARAQTSPPSVLTQRYDNLRSGVNANESILNTTNVQPATFGRIFSRYLASGVSGPRSQPLYVPGLTIKGAVRNVVFICNQNCDIFAFDADAPLTPTLWHVNLIPAGGSISLNGTFGLLGTPVIDPSTGTLYALTKTLEGPINRPASYVFRLHALDILTGQERSYSPTVVNFSMPGKGGGSIRNVISFNPMLEGYKTSLLLTQGKILFGLAAAVTETNPAYHGFVLAYDAATLQRTAVWCTTPNGSGAGVWQCSNGLITDDQGNIWVTTGNGSVNPATSDYGMAVVRLVLTASSLTAVDYFIPNTYNTLNFYDSDLGVVGPVFVPGTNYLVQGGKTGNLYVLNAFNLGGIGTTNNANIPQSISAAPNATGNEFHGRPVVYTAPDGSMTLYTMATNDYLHGYSLQPNGLIDVSSSFHGTPYGNSQGGFLLISSQGTTAGTGILWCYHPAATPSFGSVAGQLDAYDADTFDPIWSSTTTPTRDNCDDYTKWNYPTVVNGKVYLAEGDELLVYGLLNSNVPAVPTGLSATLNSSAIMLQWQSVPGASYVVRYSPVQGGPYQLVPNGFQVIGTTTNVPFTKPSNGQYNYYVVSAVNANGESANSAELAFTPLPSPPVISLSAANNVPTLSWSAAFQAKTYTVLRGTQTGGPYTAIASGLTALSYTDTTVVPGTKYYYVVTSANIFGTSANSNEVSF